MKSLTALCKPRQSIFDRKSRDVILDISDLIEGKINPKDFFEENYLTDGMKSLFREAFRRFAGKTDTGVITLTQAMGGGKTHCMIALALLAQYPELRKKVMGELYAEDVYGPIKVAAFNGRESDAPLGVWGSIAEQLGKREALKDYYSPLKAPGQTTWINLLKGERLLILLDELPPYFESAQSIHVGNSDLANVTETALSNLFVAVGKQELSQVLIVISDLKATYEGGSEKINAALENLRDEVSRGAIDLEPVGLNTDEIYHILRKRLFEELPDDATILEIAQNYGKCLRDASQMDLVHLSPDKFVQQVRDSYPFHPAIRDLYARFRENKGFQQTRGLIRLMRVLISDLYEQKGAEGAILIHPHMIDLNNHETLSEINKINPTLGNAISHDIASNGNAAAEIRDHEAGTTDATDVCKLLLVASLANIPNPILGLTRPEIYAYLCAPGRDIGALPDTINALENERCWYLHRDNSGKLHFKNTENLNARLHSLASSYTREATLPEIKEFLARIFNPEEKDCYQDVYVLPAVDDIEIVQDKVALVLYEPASGKLHADLEQFYDNLGFKNRVMFLSGQRETMSSLVSVGKEYKAIGTIIAEMDSNNVRTDDPQRITALELHGTIVHRLLSAARETFTTLFYPHSDQLRKADVLMTFQENKCRGEQLIKQTLLEKQKFTTDVDSDTFRRKCEERLFTQKSMLWTDVKRRAAVITKWQWHHPKALDKLKERMISQDQWRESSGYIDKGPFPKPTTSVHIIPWNRDDDTGEVTLKIQPVHGDRVFYDIGSPATPSSEQVQNLHNFLTSSMRVSFICTDSTGVHETGEPVEWTNKVTLKKRLYGSGKEKRIELKSAPPGAVIRYTTDGSNPRTAGGLYNEPFTVKKPTRMILAIAEKEGIWSDQLQYEISWDKEERHIDPEKPAKWKNEHSYQTTKESFDFLGNIRKHQGKVLAPRISVIGNGDAWADVSLGEAISLSADQIEALINAIRSVYSEGQVSLKSHILSFPTGQRLIEFAADERRDINPEEVTQ